MILKFLRAFLSILIFIFTISYAEAAKKKTRLTAHPVRRTDFSPNVENTDEMTFTLESNVYRGSVYLSPALSYSSKNGFDVQLASYSIPVYGGGAQNYEYDTYLNLTKTFEINNSVSLVVGTQNGTTLFSKIRQWHNFDYVIFKFKPTTNVELFVGPYYANRALTASYTQLGVVTGINIVIIPKTLDLNLSYVSGHTNVSGALAQVLYAPIKKIQMYGGIGIPEKSSGNEFFGIIGLNYTF
ncbi:MAG: hypothetical protein QXN55_00870 [Candidatus Nitrosotenuis sp.]